MEWKWLAVFGVYSLVMLIIGIKGYDRTEDRAGFAVAGRRLSTPYAVATWLATFQSGVAVVGFTGFTSLYGYSFITYLTIPIAIVTVIFTLLASKLSKLNVYTVPEIIEQRYGDYKLRLFSTLAIIILSGVAVTIQLYSAGLVLEAVTGVPLIWSIIMVGLVLTVYVVLGGMTSVVKTDMIQAICMGVGVLVITFMIINKVGLDLFVVPETMGVFSGPVEGGWVLAFAWIFVWVPGVMAQSIYLQRFYSVPDKYVARKMAAYGGTLTALFYTCVLIIGLGAFHLLPPGSLGDLAYPTLLQSELGGIIGAVGLILLIASIQSSVDSLLNIMGTYAAEDIYAKLGPEKSSESILRFARYATLAFGILTIIMAIAMSLRDLPLIAQLQSLSQGLMGATILLPLYIGLFWKKATKVGTYAAMLGGLTTTVIFYILKSNNIVSVFHESFPGLIVATILFFSVSLLTKTNDVEKKNSHNFVGK